jgi:hypothetical protein
MLFHLNQNFIELYNLFNFIQFIINLIINLILSKYLN